MFCEFCSRSKKIEPLNPENHVTIKTRDDRSIHLLHFNKERTEIPYEFTKINQPLKSHSVSKCETDENMVFNDLFESDQFNRNKFESFNILESSNQLNKAKDFSIIYRNKIELPKVTESDKYKSNRPLLFFIHGVGGKISFKIFIW